MIYQDDDEELVERCNHQCHNLTAWEEEFLESVTAQVKYKRTLRAEQILEERG
jgi:hypothetical protein